MLFVDVFVCIPLPCQERVLLADDFTVEECCQKRVLLSQTFNAEVATKVGVLLVDVLYIQRRQVCNEQFSFTTKIHHYFMSRTLSRGSLQWFNQFVSDSEADIYNCKASMTRAPSLYTY